jgi:hypothetical protein
MKSFEEDTESTIPSRAGGPAMAGGQRFQAQVTTWWCVHILLQTPLGNMFNFPDDSKAERIYCETTDNIDDIRIEFSGDNHILGQCKRRLNLSKRTNSRWAEVLVQFYNELERVHPVEMNRCFVVFYERQNSNLAKLGELLSRYRQQAKGTPLLRIATSQSEQNPLNGLNMLLDTLQTENGLQHLATRREELLRHIYIKQLNLHGYGEGQEYLKNDLRNNILANPRQVGTALESLHRLADDLIPERGTEDRIALRQHLKNKGILLQDSPDYRPDFRRLRVRSTTEIEDQETQGRLKLAIGGHEITISRPVVQEMLRMVQETSFLVVGDAGAGKTGCLLALAKKLRENGDRVWYWAADSLPYFSPEEIGTHLRLQYSWKELFLDAASGTEIILIIDGLDGLRDTRAQRAYQKLFRQAICCGIKVIASIRSFDLKYSIDLHEIFALKDNSISPEFSSDEFRKISHIIVPELDSAELCQVVTHFPFVQEILDEAPQLYSVVCNLFSLDLLCKLIADGDSAAQFSSVSTQEGLFERYWEKRIDSHELRSEMKDALKGLIKQMIDQQTLQAVSENWSGRVQESLFSAGIVRHPLPEPDRLPDEELIEFSHHLLFDYIAERLFVRPRRNRLETDLASDDTWSLFLRPSLKLFYYRTWHEGRHDFWDILLSLEKSSVPILQKMLGYLAVAEEAKSNADLQPLIEGGLQSDSDTEYWIQIIRGVVGAATFSSLPNLFNKTSGDWWIEFAHELIKDDSPQLVHTGQMILSFASDALENLSHQARYLLNKAAIMLVKYYWKENLSSSIVKSALGWVCHTIDSDIPASSEIIRRTLTHDELQRAGHILAPKVTSHIEDIWKADPNLAVEVYDAIFSYVETDRSDTTIIESRIMPLRSSKKQNYEHVHLQLSQNFSDFLSAHPGDATRALVRVIRHLRDQEHRINEASQSGIFAWNGHECFIQLDYIYNFDRGYRQSDPQFKMLYAWEDYLATLPEDDKAHEKWRAIKEALVVENEVAAVWTSLLVASIRVTEFYAQHLWTILLNPTVLTGLNIGRAAKNCIRTFVPHLSNESVNQIEGAILNIGRKESVDLDETYLEDHSDDNKVKLLLCVPEGRRGAAARQFLADYTPEQVNLHEREDGKKDKENIDITETEDEKLLQASTSLLELEADKITDENLTEILQRIYGIEHGLAKLCDKLSEENIQKIKEGITYSFAQVACSQATLNEELKKKLFEWFRNALLSQVDAPSPEVLEKFDQQPAWYTYDQCITAAEGFTHLALRMDVLPIEYKGLLCHLVNDPRPDVRYQLGVQIWEFLDVWPEFVWETAEGWIEKLSTHPGIIGVLRGSLRNSWFWKLHENNAARADQLLRNLLTATRLRNSKELLNICGMLLAHLCFFKNEKWACEAIKTAIDSFEENLDELEGVLDVAIKELLPRTDKEPIIEEQRQRTVCFLLQILYAASQMLKPLLTNTPDASAPEQLEGPPPWLEQVIHFFDNAANRFLFSSKWHAKKWVGAPQSEREAEMKVWWEAVEPIIDTLLTVPFPHFTFPLVEGLGHLVCLDVQRSLHWLKKVTLASVPMGLTYESLAADHSIGILGRVLAEHRESLALEEELRSDFLNILEAYLQVYWPKAMELALQIESIFR